MGFRARQGIAARSMGIVGLVPHIAQRAVSLLLVFVVDRIIGLVDG
jgi:hypothetical protein